MITNKNKEGLDKLIQLYLYPETSALEEIFNNPTDLVNSEKSLPISSNIRFYTDSNEYKITLWQNRLFKMKDIETAIATQQEIIYILVGCISYISDYLGKCKSESQRHWMENSSRPMSTTTLTWQNKHCYFELTSLVSGIESKARISVTVGKNP